ncbi:type I DNA topoisomerase [Patescibacteria group bacterium]|nr:type I DNA topoisomerase [Patescibacteria group bacterium]
MNLIIVESPTKARTLTRFLHGKGDWRIEATMGHVRDLPKATLGVDVEHRFEPKYVIPKDKLKRVGELRAIAEQADSVILATDPDREGEAIAWHVAEILRSGDRKRGRAGEKKKVSSYPPISSSPSRIVFHEITETAINDALAHPGTIDLHLVDAQQARRVLDRLVGYKLSPLLWQKLSRRWLSAGRVQSVAVRLIVEREREIGKFGTEAYWTVEGKFLHKGSTLGRVDPLCAHLSSKNGMRYEKILRFTLFDGKYTTTSSTIRTKDQAAAIITDLRPPFTVSAVDTKEVRRYPYPPHTTSTLQQDAGRKLYFSAKKTMQLAQKLYEEGRITYHRTDSVNLSEKFIGEARTYIEKTYGTSFVPPKPRRYTTKSKVAQEAHEAIRPTNVALTNARGEPDGELNKDHERLYELIWKRAVASQAAEAVFDSTTLSITSSNAYVFSVQGSVITFEGFLTISGREVEDMVIPAVAVGDRVELIEALPSEHQTNPPPRYTEATLVKTLEEKGIGRPSTYAPIISTIQDRQYVTKTERKLVPTDLGNTVTDFLVQYFPTIIDLPFTAGLEDSLDAVANGESAWVPVIQAFYGPFAKTLDGAYQTAEKVKMPVEETGEKCPECGSPLVIRTGKYGRFIACSTFPACKFTKQVVEKIDMKCPRCGGDIIIKKSRRGKTFYGCSNYPKCTFAAWKKEDIR